MELIVPDDKLSLAIGKKGQNVRLASQLTGWRIDIHSESKIQELEARAKLQIAADRGRGRRPGRDHLPAGLALGERHRPRRTRGAGPGAGGRRGRAGPRHHRWCPALHRRRAAAGPARERGGSGGGSGRGRGARGGAGGWCAPGRGGLSRDDARRLARQVAPAARRCARASRAGRLRRRPSFCGWLSWRAARWRNPRRRRAGRGAYVHPVEGVRRARPQARRISPRAFRTRLEAQAVEGAEDLLAHDIGSKEQSRRGAAI